MRRALAFAFSSALAATLAGTLTACGEPKADRDNGGKITIFAAASLTGVFTDLEQTFERAHPGTNLIFSFGGSSGLAQQINAGAPADVFAAASPTTMAQVKGTTPRLLARNQLVIAVTPGNPLGVKGLADLRGHKVAVCAPQVPCGAATQTVLSKAGVALTPATQELDVKAALTKLTLGEVDAALVYRTDALAAIGQIDAVEFPESRDAVNDILVSTVPEAPNPAGATAFVDFITSAPASDAFKSAGFALP
jgi:molybdate transport system substrate-binding protein